MGDGLTLEKLKIDERLREVEIHGATTNQILKDIDKSLVQLIEKVKTQNGRVTKLENWKTYILGGMGVMGGGVTLLGVAVSWFKH